MKMRVYVYDLDFLPQITIASSITIMNNDRIKNDENSGIV